MKKAVKITALILAGILVLSILVVVGYVLYVVFDYNRIEDGQTLDVNRSVSQTLNTNTTYTAMTFNIGFGAYDTDFSFFMDYAIYDNDTTVYGTRGKGRDFATVEQNTLGAIAAMIAENCDFYLLQEVDTHAHRSYFVNQYDKITQSLASLANFTNTFAVNYHSAYLFYPFHDPIGKSNSGLATYSRFAIDSAIRRQYPLDTGFAKFFDLDRCISVNRLNIAGGKQLVLINNHMSAYDEGGTIRQQQLELLNSIMQTEYALGNYVIVGGDFNHDIAGFDFATDELRPDWAIELTSAHLTEGFDFVIPDNEVATCRNAATPYVEGKNFRVVLDGFIVSDNITAQATVIDENFAYSDHNPVVLNFSLK